MTSPVPSPQPGTLAPLSPAIPPGTRGGTAGTQEGTRDRAPAAPPPCGEEGKYLAASWLAQPTDSEGPLGRQSPAPGQHSCPKGSRMAHPLPKPPTYTGRDQGRTLPPHFKPNLRALASKKGRSICRRQNLVRVRAPGEAMWEKGFQEERLGQQTGVGLEKSWRNGTQKPSSGAAGLRQAGRGLGWESRGRGHGRAGGSCTVFWALYMRLRYS